MNIESLAGGGVNEVAVDIAFGDEQGWIFELRVVAESIPDVIPTSLQ